MIRSGICFLDIGLLGRAGVKAERAAAFRNLAFSDCYLAVTVVVRNSRLYIGHKTNMLCRLVSGPHVV